jgi:hypothetical protein
MSGAMFRRGLLAVALLLGLTGVVGAQQPAKLKGFASPDAAAAALAEAVRGTDLKAIAAMWGANWREFVPARDDDIRRRRLAFLAAWNESHKTVMSGDSKAMIEVGKSGWTLPIPLVKDGSEWRFDIAAGFKEMVLRRIGHDEAAVVQTLLAIVDAQADYAALDPMNTGAPAYARRLLSAPGRKDGLYWETKPGEKESPLGPAVAKAQADGQAPDGHYGYFFRLLYAQGSDARGGARDYIVGGRMIGGFGVIAWPVRYGDTGVMTFIVNQDGVVYQQDLGPQTAQKAGAIVTFNPDKGWTKADTTSP